MTRPQTLAASYSSLPIGIDEALAQQDYTMCYTLCNTRLGVFVKTQVVTHTTDVLYSCVIEMCVIEKSKSKTQAIYIYK